MEFSVDKFDFENIKLKTPKALQGGTYSAKLVLNDKPVIIQTPKCKTKNGIHNTSKNAYCDLLMNIDHNEFIESLEKFQEKMRSLILENGDDWFHESPTIDEIEYNWNNSIRPYKKKNFLIRTFISKNKALNKFNLQIYNSNGELIEDTENINSDNTVVCILELQNLKFSSQSFHLEIILRQVMVIKEEPLFNKCLIKLDNKKTENTETEDKIITTQQLSESNNIEDAVEDTVENNNTNDDNNNTDDNNKTTDNNILEKSVKQSEVSEEESEDESDQSDEESDNENIDISKNNINNLETSKVNLVINEEPPTEKTPISNVVEIEDNEKKPKTLEKMTELEEINLNIDNESTIKLKNPNEVYLDIYRAAKQKAKQAKKQAIKAYLEAKKIKDLYLLDSIDTSEDESDTELELFSEN